MFELSVRQRLAAIVLLICLTIAGLLIFYNTSQGYTEEIKIDQTQDQIAVHVCGAVAKSGVFLVKPGTRRIDVIKLAGGALAEADLDRINLAEYVSDGEQLYLPKKGEELPVTNRKSTKPVKADNKTIQSSTKPAMERNGPYDLNSVTQQELERIPGIGPALAGKILQYRQEHGAFRSYDDLIEVPGVGQGKLAKFREYLYVK